MKTIKFTITIFLLYTSLAVSAQNTVKGYVYTDINNNHTKDKNEPVLKGIAVSNGLDVVLTNEKGLYELPISNDGIIFIIKPSNYKFLLNEFNLPQFYYIHKPGGSPKLKYQGVEPTGNLPKTVNFGLIEGEQNDEYRLLVFGDPQPRNLKEIGYFNKGIVTELIDVPNVEFGISMGDLVWDDLDLFLPYKETVMQIGVPWHNVLGNHDINFDVDADSLSDETYEKHFGPANYAFNHGMAHFIILDDVQYPDPRDGKGYWGGLTKKQLTFIKNDLKHVPKDHLIVLGFHIPISEEEDGYEAFNNSEREQLFKLLKNYPNTLSISAHTHFQSQDFLFAEHGWSQPGKHHHFNVGTTCGDWNNGRFNRLGVPDATMRDGTPRGYAFLNIYKNRYTIDYKVSGKPDDYKMKIFAPKMVKPNQFSSFGIVVNFFIGTEYDTLSFRIDNNNWQPMRYIETYDPTYFKEVLDWDTASEVFKGNRPSNPITCDHLWHGNLPTNLEIGEHIIEVKAIDMFGREHLQTSTYTISQFKE